MNGWKNWETWIFNLHCYEDIFQTIIGAESLQDDFEESIEDGKWIGNEETDDLLREKIKEELDQQIDHLHEMWLGKFDQDPFLGDIVSGFTSEIDQIEIADHLFDDLKSYYIDQS